MKKFIFLLNKKHFRYLQFSYYPLIYLRLQQIPRQLLIMKSVRKQYLCY